MCWMVAAAQAGLGIIGSVMQQRAAEQSAVAQGEAMKQQAETAIKSMNREFMNYEIERKDAFDQAVQEITTTRLNAMQLNSAVEAAVNEDMAGGGRTADRIVRSVQGDEARKVASVQDNYQRKSNEIDLNKETNLLSTKDYVASLKPPKMPSRSSMYLNMASSVLGAYETANTAKANAISKGADWDFYKGAVIKKKP